MSIRVNGKVIASNGDVKTETDNLVTTDTNQTITASKNLKTGGTVAYSRPFQIFMPTSTESNPTENKTREIAFLASEGSGNNYEGSLTHTRSTTGESYTGLRAGRLVNGTYKEGALGVRILADGTTFSIAPNTPDNAPNNAIVTKGYADAELNAKADKDIPVIGIPATSGTVTLSDNTVYSGTMTGEMTFALPAVTNATQYHQIKAMLYLPVVTINWGTTHYIGGEAPDVSGAGQYMIYWDYVPALSAWAVGAMKVG